MAISAQEIVAAFDASGFDQASLTMFLKRSKLQTELNALEAQRRNRLA